MSRLSSNPALRLWSRSLPFQVVVTTLAAAIVILAATGWFLMEQSSRGIMAGKTQASVAEASAVVSNMQRDLSTTDLRTTSASERITRLAREATNRGLAGNQYFVVVETPIQKIGTGGLAPESIPDSIRESVGSGDGLWSTPTLIRFTDSRPDEPGLVVAATLQAPGQAPYPIFFLFSTSQEKATLAVVQQATLATGVFLLAGLTLTVYLIALQVLRPVRAARLAAEQLASGHLEDRMAVVGTEDLAGLARSMNHMAEELDKKITQLQNLSLVQQRFVSDVSHELRTPLTTIRMAAEVLHSHRDEFDAVSRRSTELLSAELDRFEGLLTDLLEISRFDAGAAQLALDYVDLTVLAGEEMAAQQRLAERTHTQLTLDSGGNCVAEVDGRRIRRVLRNLITNAIEHGEGRPITVYVRGDENAVAVAVRDHGVGFTAEEGSQVFNRFWRADPSRGRHVGGTGLGLSISLEDARLHGGRLDAWGSPGAGAQFRLTVPRKAAEELQGSPWPSVPPDAKVVLHA
ncbi:MAG TPA: MtrAB system histidine kinase MtrB [Propionicimonas sp.]|nr:MtrAB system histidine kinase MtrB [Propionicimonas sp.]HQA78165.1 MtrAB system histidine kinase MtrB [Propionicimonas sp.]HQD96323.1 MtrAB system histidine kinase MtrB [Propionicimonas sp.]